MECAFCRGSPVKAGFTRTLSETLDVVNIGGLIFQIDGNEGFSLEHLFQGLVSSQKAQVSGEVCIHLS